MPSIETQTTWSWIRDLSILTQVLNTHKGLELSLSQQNILELNTTTDKNTQSTTIPEATDLLDKDPEALALSYNSEGFAPVTTEQQQRRSSQAELLDATQRFEVAEKGLRLPNIVPVSNQETANKDDKRSPENVSLPPVIQQPAEQTDNSSTSDSTYQDTIDEDEQDVSLPNLPWPKILQYMRESESYAAKYFGLQNKHKMAKRLKASKNTTSRARRSQRKERGVRERKAIKDGCADEVDLVTTSPQQEVMATQSTDEAESTGSSSSSEGEASESESTDNELEGEETDDGMDECEFCGEQKPKYSFLSATVTSSQEPTFCCDGYKEFCVLVATCLRQLVDKLQHGPPQKISVKLSKKQIKKTAEQRAFAMMCRKRKWEQLLKKKMQQKKTPMKKTAKQTRIIQFSLLSTSILDTGWMVRPQSITKHRTPRQKKALVKRENRRRLKQLNVLSPGVLKRLQNDMPADIQLDQRTYSDKSPFVTILPNRTGQCYYHSGNIAVAVFSPYQGILAYLLFEDSTKALLGYLDELGRVCCYYADGKIQLYSSQSGGITFDPNGDIKRQWTWEGNSSFQPTTLSLNRQLAVRCQNRGYSIVTFAADHKVIKFIVSCRLQRDEELHSVQDSTHVNWLGEQLQQRKKQISCLLHSLQSSDRSRKLAQMRSIYNSVGREIPQQHGTRQRTRSTGAIQLHTQTHTAVKHK